MDIIEREIEIPKPVLYAKDRCPICGAEVNEDGECPSITKPFISFRTMEKS